MTIPCPRCETPLTVEDFEEFSTPFTMKCPYCGVKLRETRVTPFLIIIALLAIPLFIYLGVVIKEFLAGYLPVVQHIPTIIVFLAFCYPLYALYEAFNAKLIMTRGNLHVKE